MNTPTRLVAILGGIDWADASVEHVAIPEGMDLAEQKSKWDDWYRDVYQADETRTVTYLSFADWLKKEGGRDADEIEEFWQ